MFLQIDHHSGVPAYKQLIDQIRFQISSGSLNPGDEMPSTRILSARLELNPMTISKAYGILQSEGVLERQKKGKPLRVSAVDEKDIEANKDEQLRRALSPVVKAARQLGFSKTEAAKIFKEVFDQKDNF